MMLPKATKAQIKKATNVYNSRWPYIGGYRADILEVDGVYLLEYCSAGCHNPTQSNQEYYLLNENQFELFDVVEYDDYNSTACAQAMLDIADILLSK